MLMDVILLPLEAGEFATEAADVFDLPNEWSPTYSH